MGPLTEQGEYTAQFTASINEEGGGGGGVGGTREARRKVTRAAFKTKPRRAKSLFTW